jgi:transposase
MNKEMYVNILRRLRVAVRRKCPEKWRTSSWFLLHNNAPAHWSVLGNDFLTENNVTTMGHPPYSPDMAPSDFYLFPQLKSAMKAWHFCDATDITNVTEELKRLSKNGFQVCSQHLYSRWLKCIVAQED